MVAFLDEFNLATADVQTCIMPILDEPNDEGKRGPIIGPEGEEQLADPHFRIIAAQNPVGMVGRTQLPSALKARFIVLQVDAYSSQEITNILMKSEKLKRALNVDLVEWKCAVLQAHFADLLASVFVKTNMLLQQRGCSELSVRFLMKRINRVNTCKHTNANSNPFIICGLALLGQVTELAGHRATITRALIAGRLPLEAGPSSFGSLSSDGFVTVAVGGFTHGDEQ